VLSSPKQLFQHYTTNIHSYIKLDLTNRSDRNSLELPFAEKFPISQTQFSALSQALTLKHLHFHLDLEFLVNLELVESPHT